jgi:hypothetical membrane protein
MGGATTLVAALFWISTVQFYIVQYITARAWREPFSLSQNYISDLGNRFCTESVCSPMQLSMNISFVLLGLAIIIGALLFAYVYRANNGLVMGLLCLAISGLGTMFVGLFPADVNGAAHGTGAFASFFIGNVGLVIIGITFTGVAKALRALAIALGLIALIGLPFYQNNIYFGIGVGGLERVIAYPQTIWMITFGTYVALKARGTKASS